MDAESKKKILQALAEAVQDERVAGFTMTVRDGDVVLAKHRVEFEREHQAPVDSAE